MTLADSELTAYLWLLALPRNDDRPPGACAQKMREIVDRQVKIFLCPGKLGTAQGGAPRVRVMLLLPGRNERVSGQGNSLYEACDRLQGAAWQVGVRLPLLSTFHL